jgi:hypothetical protein
MLQGSAGRRLAAAAGAGGGCVGPLVGFLFFFGKNTKLVHVVYLIYNLLLVVSKRTQKSLCYVKKII